MEPMDLFKTWQVATVKNITDNKTSKEEIMEAIKSTSSSTIGKIKSRMKIKLGWIILFISLCLIWVAFDHSNSELMYIQTLLIVLFGSGFISLYPIYKKMNNSISTGADSLTVMKSNLNLVRQALKRETIWGLIVFPIAAAVGFVIGTIKSGGSIADVISDPKSLLILLVVSAIFIPLANIGSYKANQKAFGGFISELDQNIVKMETL